MTLKGQPVFDGPATNALAHLLHSATCFLGNGFLQFAQPDSVSATLCRSRDIESYDTAWIKASFAEAELDVILTHAVSELIPYQVIVEGTEGTAIQRENVPVAFNTIGLKCPNFEEVSYISKTGMYEDFLGSDDAFEKTPSKLVDVRGYTMLTNMALISTSDIKTVPANAIKDIRTTDHLVEVQGLAENIKAFAQQPKSLYQMGYAWAPEGRITTRQDLDSFEFPSAGKTSEMLMT
jgi:hypothetical protein